MTSAEKQTKFFHPKKTRFSGALTLNTKILHITIYKVENVYLTYSIGFIDADISAGLNEAKEDRLMSKTDTVQMRKFVKSNIILHPCK